MNRNLLFLAQADPESGEAPGFLEQIIGNFGWAEAIEIAAIVFTAVFLGWLFKRFVLRRFRAMAEATDNDVDDRLVHFLSRFYTGILFFAAIVVILKVLRVDLTPLLAGAGILGIGVGFAAKDIIGNFLAGVFLLIDRPIKIGDRILIERIGRQWGGWGDVIDVGLRTTVVRSTDGVHVTYPNAKLADSIIKNFSPSARPVRVRVRVLVGFDNDLEAALACLMDAAEASPQVLSEPKLSAVVRSFFDETGGHLHHGALLELRCYVDDVRIRTRLRSRLLLSIKRRFDEAGISFARPDVHVRSQL